MKVQRKRGNCEEGEELKSSADLLFRLRVCCVCCGKEGGARQSPAFTSQLTVSVSLNGANITT